MPQFYQHPAQQPTCAPQLGANTPELKNYWEKIVPHLFKTGLTRTSKDGGNTYPRSTEHPLPQQIPAAPTATRIYHPNGTTSCIALDFDSKTAGAAAVTRDVATATDFLTSHGITRIIVDASPSAGQHLYIPLAHPLPFTAAKMVTAALKTLLPTLDTAPMNGLTDGVIRVPGSAHKSGGHQQPLTPLGTALMAVHIRNPLDAISSLYRWAQGVKEAQKHTNPHLAPGAGGADGKSLIKVARSLPGTRNQPLPLMPEWAHMAKTGTWDKKRYRTPSEARLGFTRACIRAGHTFTTFLAALHTPAYAGAAKLWDRYSPEHRLSAMARDFAKAHSYKGVRGHVQDCNTRDNLHTPLKGAGQEKARAEEKAGSPDGDAYMMVRTWFAAVQKVEATRYAQVPAARLVLRALGAMVQRTGEPLIDVGVRSLALATGLSASTVSRLLVMLRNEEEPFIRMVSPARGLDAAVYALETPQALSEAVEQSWYTGLIPAVDKAFFGLPAAAPLIYEVLSAEAVSSIDLAAITGLPLRTVQATLEELATLGLAQKTAGGWVLGPTNLMRAALISGGAALFTAMLVAIRAQRTAWREFLLSRRPTSGYQPCPGDRGIPAGGEVYDPALGVWVPMGELCPA